VTISGNFRAPKFRFEQKMSFILRSYIIYAWHKKCTIHALFVSRRRRVS
jgi:hypothetical protein